MVVLVLAILAVALGRGFVLVAGHIVDIVRLLYAFLVTLGLVAPTARSMPCFAVFVAVVVVAVLMAMVHLALEILLFLFKL